jgi:hypothetical protein
MRSLVAEARGRCVSCDVVLPKPKRGGRPKSVLCGEADCRRVYHQLRRSRVRELAWLGLQVEMKRALESGKRALESVRAVAAATRAPLS